jgi:hypothetical protein
MDINDRAKIYGSYDQPLVEIDENHHVYLCEHGIVHLQWGKDMLPYCPADFVGLPFLLSGLKLQCEMQCLHGEECVHIDPEDNLVHLEYGSVRIPLTPDECRSLRDMVQEAANKLYVLGCVG